MRRIDHDDDREHRFVRRHKPDERHVVVGVAAIAAVDELLRRAGLSGHGVTLNLRRFAGAFGDDASMICVSVAAVLAVIARELCAAQAAACGRESPHERHGAARARRRWRRTHRSRHLQRRHADLVAHRHRGQRAVGELRRIPHDARALAAKIRRRRLADQTGARSR